MKAAAKGQDLPVTTQMKTVDALVDVLVGPALAVPALTFRLGSAPEDLLNAGAAPTARRLRKQLEAAPQPAADHEAIVLRCAIGFREVERARAHAAEVTEDERWGRSMLARLAELEGDRKTVARIIKLDPKVWLDRTIAIAIERGDVARVRALATSKPAHYGPVQLAVAEARALLAGDREAAARKVIAALAKALDARGRKRDPEYHAWQLAVAQGWEREAIALAAGGLGESSRARGWLPYLPDIEEAAHLAKHGGAGGAALAAKIGGRFDAWGIHGTAQRAHARSLLGQRAEARALAAQAEVELDAALATPDDKGSLIVETVWMWQAMGDTAQAIRTFARAFAAGWDRERTFQHEGPFALALATARTRQRATPAILAAVDELRAALA